MTTVEEAVKLALEARAAAAAEREHAYLRADLPRAQAARKVSEAADRLLRELARPTLEARSRATVLKADPADRFLLTVAYSAHKMPARGADGRVDIAGARALEKAAWSFARHGFRVGIDHKPGGEGAAQVVESWIHRGPPWEITCPDGTTETVKAGDWLVGMILSPQTWREYKAGRFGGVSMQGRATRRRPSREMLARMEA